MEIQFTLKVFQSESSYSLYASIEQKTTHQINQSQIRQIDAIHTTKI